MSIVERMHQNDPEFTELCLTEAPDVYSTSMEEFILALKQNTVIDYVRIDRDFLPNMSEDYVAEFLTALGALPSLKEVHIWHASLSVQSLAGFFEQATNLELLEFGCIEFAGTPEDFRKLSDTIKVNASIRIFYMIDFSFSGDNGDINKIVESLACLPTLEVVKLEVTSSRRRSLCGSEAAMLRPSVQLSGLSLAALVKSKALRELQLNRMQLKLRDYEMLAAALNESPALTSLSIPNCELTDDACSSLAVAIANVNCRLKEIDFSCNKLSDEGCILIASALKGNTSVNMLRLWGNIKISNSGFLALVEMLEVNCHLERVPLMAPIEFGTKIDAALNKNRSAKIAKITNSAA